MEQSVYVDVLLATNYIINMLLVMCVGRFSGRSPKRRRIVAAALFGAASSLTIFLPFMGFFPSLLMKLGISAIIVLIAFSYISASAFLKQIFLFFAVSFSFAGVMLGIWMMFTPQGMTYYNGIVYFDISPLLLIITTIVSYVLLGIAKRFAGGKKLRGDIYRTTIFLGKGSVTLNALVDTGNHLTEPFSNSPVAVCEAKELYPILPPGLVDAACENRLYGTGIFDFDLRIRMIPYSNVGGSGVMPAFKADLMVIETPDEKLRAERVYVGLSAKKIGDERYSCLLNPDIIAVQAAENLLTVVPRK